MLPQLNPEPSSWQAFQDYVRHGAQVEGLLDNACHWLSIVRQRGTIVAAHFLGYTLVWEYHFTMLLVAVPFLCADWLGALPGVERRLALLAFLSVILLYLPTPYFLWPHRAGRHLVLLRLLRVGPVMGVYGAGMALVTWRILQGLRRESAGTSNVLAGGAS